MTDDEIIKALECCRDNSRCYTCPRLGMNCCMNLLMRNALDLINRQKGEIEQWKEEANRYQNLWCMAVDDIRTAKSEAIKDFAERLKEKLQWDVEFDNKLVLESGIDNLVKEMTEEW